MSLLTVNRVPEQRFLRNPVAQEGWCVPARDNLDYRADITYSAGMSYAARTHHGWASPSAFLCHIVGFTSELNAASDTYACVPIIDFVFGVSLLR
jgi:hypothetical protein